MRLKELGEAGEKNNTLLFNERPFLVKKNTCCARNLQNCFRISPSTNKKEATGYSVLAFYY